MSAKLGESLVRENLISPQNLREALDYQREHGGRLGYNLVKLRLVSDDMSTAVLSRQYGVPSVNLELFDIDDSVIRLIPHEVEQKYSVLPLSRVGAFFFSSRRRHTRFDCDWSSDVCSSD